MNYRTTEIDGCFILEYGRNRDERGSFSRVACKRDLESIGVDFDMVQTSVVTNKYKGTIRGLHFQNYPMAESKIVTCVSGMVNYVVVDLRGDSKTFKNVTQCIMHPESDYQLALYIPAYCASGYQTMEDNTNIIYYMDEYYEPALQSGINCFSKKLNIKWLPGLDITMSEKDRKLQELIV